MGRSLVIAILSICAFGVAVSAELYDYGSPDELRGIRKYYVDAGEDLDLRNIIAERFRTADVDVVDRPEDAEHWVVFRWSGSGQSFWTRTIIIRRDGNRQRLLMTYRGAEQDLDDLAGDAGKALAKRLREINGTN